MGGTHTCLHEATDIIGLGQGSAVDLFPESQRMPFFSGAHVPYHGQGLQPLLPSVHFSPTALISGSSVPQARPPVSTSPGPQQVG